jgi:hypothetical protein
MEQTLSVADFATILELVNREMVRIESHYRERERTFEKFGLREEPHWVLEEDKRYQDLQHLKQSLQNLNVEVEIPKVEVETNEP